ncbi:MAG: VCBS repeat-containing protein, partial [Candidatus Eisenbacteria bacterium]
AVGNMNGDDKLDVVIGTKTGTNQGKLEVWWGDGDGNFTHSASLDVYTASGEVRGVAIADMNLDGRADIVAGTKTNNPDTQGNIDIFFGGLVVDGRFTTSYSVAAGGAVYGIALGRMDSDGYPDVITAVKTGSTTGKIEFWQGQGTLLAALARRDAQATPGPALSVAVGRLDVTAGLDIVVGTAGAGGSTPPAVQMFFCDPDAAAGAIIPDLYSWADANAGGSVNAVAIGRLECSQDRLGDDQLNDVIAGTATSASEGDLVIYLNPYSSTIVP